MTRHIYPRYARYKESGVEWLGPIPRTWDSLRIKYLCRINPEALSETTDTDYALEYVDIGNVDPVRGIVATEQHSFGSSPSRARRIVRHGDVIVSTVRTYLKAIARIENPPPNLVVSTGFAVLRPLVGIDSRFISYALHAPHFLDWVVANSVGVSYPAINASVLAGFSIIVPPFREQRAIADFLDRETAKIDALIERQERLLEKLEEKRKAMIAQAVTRGLDSNVPLKESGVAWLGKIPEHWECLALARITLDRCDGPFGSGLKSSHYTDDGVRVIRLQNIGYAQFRGGDAVYIGRDYYSNELGDHGIKAGDLLVAGLGDERHPVGRACVAPDEIEMAMVKADCFRFRLNTDKSNVQYLAYQLSCTAESAASCFSTGATRSRMSLTTTAARKVVLPPLAEQNFIVDRLNADTRDLEFVTSKVRNLIEKLRERRTALISAAVTGKIAVGGHHQ